MGFYEVISGYKDFDFDSYFERLTDDDILRVIAKDRLDKYDYLALLSEKAGKHMEEMAVRSRQLTIQHFGRVIFLFAPLYLANFCENECVYCGFNVSNTIIRRKLSIEEVDEEAKVIVSTGIRHILILTGESRKESPVSYIKECVDVLKKYFRSIAIEVYPLETAEYAELINAGVDGLSLYQEVYNEETYKSLHLKGPKSNYRYRLDAPERACMASMRNVNIGALLGLDEWRKEGFFVGMHADYLQNNYPDSEISVSLPRIRPHVGHFQPKCNLTDHNLVQLMLALRLFLPRSGISISTRERAELRDNLLGIGLTRMSAGSSTEVGGYSVKKQSEGQFDISDSRTVEEVKTMIYHKGYQPVFKDWQVI